MSGENPLIKPIKGYTIAVYKLVEPGESANLLMEEDLRLTKVGGAHITNADSLLMMIEDAVFKEENRGDSG
jgi:hypothetical protein